MKVFDQTGRPTLANSGNVVWFILLEHYVRGRLVVRPRSSSP